MPPTRRADSPGAGKKRPRRGGKPDGCRLELKRETLNRRNESHVPVSPDHGGDHANVVRQKDSVWYYFRGREPMMHISAEYAAGIK